MSTYLQDNSLCVIDLRQRRKPQHCAHNLIVPLSLEIQARGRLIDLIKESKRLQSLECPFC